MMTGMNGLDDAKIITHARMQATREYLKAIRAAEAAQAEKPNRIANGIKAALQLVKNLRPQQPACTIECELVQGQA
jgi:hypothetical protein